MRYTILLVIWIVCSNGLLVSRADDSAAVPVAPSSEASRARAMRQRAEERLAVARKELSQRESEARDLEGALRAKTGRVDVSPDSLRQAASRIENELESLQLDAAGATARMEALSKTVATVEVRGKDAADRDEVSKQLSVVVAARQDELAMKQKLTEQGSVSQAELGDARARVAEAKARLAERQMNVTAAAGGGAMADWNRELLNLSLDAQERQARLTFLSTRLERLRSGLPLLDQYEELREAIPAARRKVEEAARDLDGVEQALASQSPPAPKKP